ncbi:hypothetical protein GSI_11498 [Ganoderma sinense ZZ0214-1]|uniref:Uncharacterized protein n=1 Tax=Ganoderma sinense ZZ0214-1 TaxID=1077348 RepID=A0A2G8RWQ6_9APHY|nr:hypothetical protein GSI_11498 [Ganoderma sinense ZZ0214-1]
MTQGLPTLREMNVKSSNSPPSGRGGGEHMTRRPVFRETQGQGPGRVALDASPLRVLARDPPCTHDSDAPDRENAYACELAERLAGGHWIVVDGEARGPHIV